MQLKILLIAVLAFNFIKTLPVPIMVMTNGLNLFIKAVMSGIYLGAIQLNQNISGLGLLSGAGARMLFKSRMMINFLKIFGKLHLIFLLALGFLILQLKIHHLFILSLTGFLMLSLLLHLIFHHLVIPKLCQIHIQISDQILKLSPVMMTFL